MSAVAIGITLVVIECGFRLFRPQKHFATTVNTWDPVVGTRQVPDARGFVNCPEYNIDLVINSKGLRDREYAYTKPAGTRRILCLGDSYTCGYGVQMEETFPKVLEALLVPMGERAGPWEVINAGVGSTGTAQQLAYFESEGFRYEPDVVLLCFCPANDFHDNLVSGLYSLEQGELCRHPAPRTGPRRLQWMFRWIPARLFARSHLLNYLKYRLTVFHLRKLATRVPTASDPQVQSDRLDALARRLIMELRDACDARQCRLAVALVPPPHVGGLPERTARLVESLRTDNIDVLDLTPEFQTVERQGVVTSWPRDGHWTSAGHELAARTILGFLLEHGLIRTGNMAADGNSSAHR